MAQFYPIFTNFGGCHYNLRGRSSMINESETKPIGTWRAWLLAIRPKTLPAATAGVIAGTAAAYADGGFRPLIALAALAAALLLQILANVSNDYFDFFKGTDTKDRLGPLRVTQAGLIPPRQVAAGIFVIVLLSILAGLYLILEGGWPLAVVGALAILSALAYTGGPYPLGYHGLGDLFVFIFFGLAAVCGTYYAQTQQLTFNAVWAALPIGLLTVNLLAVNNLRDIDTDRASGKRTMAVRLGEKGTLREFGIFLGLAYLIPLGAVLANAISAWVLLAWLSLPLGLRLYRDLATVRGRALNKTLAQTGQLDLLFSILYSIGLIVSKLMS
jgi:1,4-dihydroxy-2-naphthoate octaprenyltransferase